MKKQFLFLMAVILLASLISACAPTNTPDSTTQFEYQNQLKDTGLFERHSLTTPLEKSTAVQGSFSGYYFILAGGVNGEISSTTVLTFRWSPLPGKFKTSEIPRSKFETNVDDEVQTPYIVFIFKQEWLNSCFVPTKNIIACGNMNPSDKANLNNFVESDNLVSVQVYISSKDRAAEPLLP